MVVSDNKFVFRNCGKYIVPWIGKFIVLYVFILIHPILGRKRINFHDGTSKR